MTIEILLNQFYTDLLLVKRDSEQTAITYKISAEEFLNWLVTEHIKLKDVSVQNLLYYIIKRKEDGCSELTIAKDISGLRAFGDYLERKGMWSENPAMELDKPKAARNLPKVLSIEQIDSLLDSIDKTSLSGKRDDALFELVYSCGLRISEVCTLKLANLHLEERLILVHGKGDKMREIPLIVSLSEEILLYLEAVEQLVGKQRFLNEPLLVTYSGRRLYPVYVDRTVKSELGQVSTVTGRKSPHVLRHSLATELLDEGADLNSIKELLGHSSLAATQVYTHNTIARLKAIYQTAHPRAKNGGKHGD